MCWTFLTGQDCSQLAGGRMKTAAIFKRMIFLKNIFFYVIIRRDETQKLLKVTAEPFLLWWQRHSPPKLQIQARKWSRVRRAVE